MLGSHRSGTSVLARALLAIGVNLGDGLMEPRSYNPKGFFEDQITYQLNEGLLSRIERQWNSLLLPDSVDPEVISAYQNSLKQNVIRRFGSLPLWGLKDPRISRLWRYWLPALVEAGVEPVFILANRHPYSVASSLFKRDQMPEVQALALWAVHQLDGLEALLQHGGLVVEYDLMMEQPRQELQRIASFLGVGEQLDPDAVAKFENEFLADDLRHSRYTVETAGSAASPLQALCLDIYSKLLSLAQLPGGLTSEALAHARISVSGFRSELARSVDWMRAIDALQAALAKVSRTPANGVACIESEARLYISELVDGFPQAYAEFRGSAALYPIAGQRQTLRLPMPADLKHLARIRLDPASRPAALWLHRMALMQADGSELWCWNGDVGSLLNVAGLTIRPGAEGLLLVSLNDDPWFELAVAEEVLASLTANASLVVELTPGPLLEVVSEVLSQDDRLIGQMRDELLKSAAHRIPVFLAGSATSSLHLASDLESIASLLKKSLAWRDQTIAHQSIQLEQMREELVRAEAQLELLKDLLLGGPEDDRL